MSKSDNLLQATRPFKRRQATVLMEYGLDEML
jgi:hypothetical protein